MNLVSARASRVVAVLLAGVLSGPLAAAELQYAPAPPDNPLKGFIPYLDRQSDFPHSLVWDYTKLSDVMTGPSTFDWRPFERKLEAAAARGCQFYARFYLEWPGRRTGVPQFLLNAGVELRTWTNTNTGGKPLRDHTPDYEDLRLRAALTNFIHAFGARYDGDPRLGFVAVGLLGTWGEWHTYPSNHWFASKTVQREVMEAYERAFRRTKLVIRYPAGPEHPVYTENHARAIGYHDDSFGYHTLGHPWYFESELRRAGAQDKWRTQPLGGEVRPELWDCLFDEPSCAPRGQEFDRCVKATRVSWLCNEGVFRRRLEGVVRERAVRAAQRLGYELHVARAKIEVKDDHWRVTVVVTNTGVAPFYYDWPVELAALTDEGNVVATWRPGWQLPAIVPGEPAIEWTHRIPRGELPPGIYQVKMRVPNPMPGGRPLRFANANQDRERPGWVTLGRLAR